MQLALAIEQIRQIKLSIIKMMNNDITQTLTRWLGYAVIFLATFVFMIPSLNWWQGIIVVTIVVLCGRGIVKHASKNYYFLLELDVLDKVFGFLLVWIAPACCIYFFFFKGYGPFDYIYQKIYSILVYMYLGILGYNIEDDVFAKRRREEETQKSREDEKKREEEGAPFAEKSGQEIDPEYIENEFLEFIQIENSVFYNRFFADFDQHKKKSREKIHQYYQFYKDEVLRLSGIYITSYDPNSIKNDGDEECEDEGNVIENDNNKIEMPDGTCQSCGAQNSEQSEICEYCGNAL